MKERGLQEAGTMVDFRRFPSKVIENASTDGQSHSHTFVWETENTKQGYFLDGELWWFRECPHELMGEAVGKSPNQGKGGKKRGGGDKRGTKGNWSPQLISPCRHRKLQMARGGKQMLATFETHPACPSS